MRSVSEPINLIDEYIQSFGKNLMRLMYKWDGVGLAAPQIGRNLRMIAVTQWKKNKIIKEMIMINPEILETSKETLIDEEACLSLPDIFGDVKRYQNIVVSYQDIKGNKQERKFTHMDARVIQHEIDHLNGILFIDKLVK
ncbi:MAG: peptide deformylase [bacterium]|nr:peptide deformylase [bacterium]